MTPTTPRLLRSALFYLVGLAGLAAAGCGEPCDKAHLCSLSSDSPPALCDGSEFRTCGDANRNQMVVCSPGKTAVCTPTGWTFDTGH